MKTFGEIVRARRIASGFTLERLARRLGTHKGYISGWETGTVSPPSRKILPRLARALEMDEQHLLALAWWGKRPRNLQPEAAYQLLSSIMAESR